MNPTAVAVAIALVGFGLGWTVNGWRLAGELERRAGVIETQHQALGELKGANERCTAGVADVRKSLGAFFADVDARSARVEAALEAAERAAGAHQEAARAALARARPEAGRECTSAADEARAYATRRKAAP